MLSPFFIIQRAYAELLDGDYISAIIDLRYSVVHRLLDYNDETRRLHKEILLGLNKLMHNYTIEKYDDVKDKFLLLFDVLEEYGLNRWD